MERRPTCWPRGVLGVLEHAVARGASAIELERALSVRMDELRTRERRVPLELYYDAVELAASVLDAPHFGLDYIDAVEPSSLDAIGFYAMASDTVGEAFRRILRFHRFLVDAERFDMEVQGDAVTFTCTMWGPRRPAHAHVAEMHLADCLLLVPRVTGYAVSVREVRLAHDVPDRATFEARIGFDRPRYGADAYVWTLDAAMLDVPMPRPDAALSRFLEAIVAERAGAYVDESIAGRVRALLERRLASGPPSLAEAAYELGFSARTLQRRLADEHVRFDELVDEVRRATARRCQERGSSLEEAAFLCGYSEPSAFHRARRRWGELARRPAKRGA